MGQLNLVQSMRAVTAEFIATGLFVFLGAGTVMATQGLFGIAIGEFRDVEGGIDFAQFILPIAVAHGLAIALLVAAIWRISGGHINPAVTFGAVLSGRMNPLLGVLYVAAQVAGAVTGAALLKAVFLENVETLTNLGAHSVNLNAISSVETGALVEAILTFVLVFTVFATAIDSRGPTQLAPIAIGLAVLADHMVGVPLTGASMNPARSFGPAAIANFWDDQWVYWVGPLLGGGLAALTYTFLFMGDDGQAVAEPEVVAPQRPDEGEGEVAPEA
ncbi:MAG: MIP family channel protein [Dehalococcoidia bacterium]